MCLSPSETRRQFEIAFKMYDVDGSDYIDQEEFSRVERSVTAQRDNAVSCPVSTTLKLKVWCCRVLVR